MIRKTLVFISLTFIAITNLMAMNDDWYKYTLFCDGIEEIVETSNKVYYLSGGNLFSFSPSDNESYAYNHMNKLNDKDIIRLYYNSDKKYLLLVYKNSNIDIIFDEGKIINLPEIKDASVSSSKTINDVAFGSDRIAIATDFGFVIYDDNKFEVKESGIYDQVINSIGIMNGYLLIYGHYATNYKILYSPLNQRHNTLEKFSTIFSWGIGTFKVINDEILAFKDYTSKKLYTIKVDFDNVTTTRIVNGLYPKDSAIKSCRDGYYTIDDSNIIVFDGQELKTYSLPAQLSNQNIDFYDNPQKVWGGDADGIAQYDITSSPITVLHDKMIYPDYITDKRVGYMNWSRDKQRLYISNREESLIHQLEYSQASPYYQTTNIIEGNRVIDASLKNASADHERSIKYQETFGNKRMYGDPTMIVEDPDDPDKYYCGNYLEGVYVLKLNNQTGEYEEIGKFTAENSPMVDNWGPRAMFLDIDKEGNLWVGHQFGSIMSILPAEKRRQDPSTITKADWKAYSTLESLNYAEKDFTGLICRKSNMVFFSMAKYNKGFIAIDTKGTYTNPDDDTIYHWTRLTDQDGNEVTFTYITFFLEDDRGCVWVGTTTGVFEITNPSTATDHNMRVRRIKVPRNDGTNYADYLLDSDKINWIATDPSDRKWIATQSSGLFLVSETGDAILRQYTMDNSPMMSNIVWSVECDYNDNTVYVGTDYGLLSFKSDSAPGRDDYSEIYAYPNPVRPEYSGMVTITGLMDRSVVKITDSVGNVVYETRSEGGMATWDVSNAGGDRVRSGVYYVYASQNNEGMSMGAVTKILVIN